MQNKTKLGRGRFTLPCWLTRQCAFLFGYLVVGTIYRAKTWGRTRIPLNGPVLFISNHQSFFDPLLLGLVTPTRPFFAMARASLFTHWITGPLFRKLNAIPVKRGTSDMKAMRRCIEVLKQNHALLVFPEGTRCDDGQTLKFSSGIMLLVKRAKPTIVPIAIDGAYAIWPKSQKLPSLTGRIGVMVGEPIKPEELLKLSNEQATEMLQNIVESMRLDIHQRITR